MGKPKNRRFRFALTGGIAVAVAMLGGAAFVFKSSPALACYDQTYPAFDCNDCWTAGGSTGYEGCRMDYAVSYGYCYGTGGSWCYSD